ncbi:MAG: manganese efflux pump [Firmicutes bacterium]|nr:manganese efflux pump [Bacillota bacterium]
MESIHIAWVVIGFILVISVDLFACGFGYGTGKNKVPPSKIFVINLLGTIVIGAGLFSGYLLRPIIDPEITKWVSFGILFCFGIIKLTQWFVSRGEQNTENTKFTWRETFAIGIALSFDGFAVGFGATIASLGLPFIIAAIVLSLITDPLVFAVGQYIGGKVKERTTIDLSWLSGVILMIIAIVGLV